MRFCISSQPQNKSPTLPNPSGIKGTHDLIESDLCSVGHAPCVILYVGKDTDRKWEEGYEISLLEFAATEYGRKGKVIASEEVKAAIQKIGINKCARESGFHRANFIRKLIRDLPVKRNSYNDFLRWLGGYNSELRG